MLIVVEDGNVAGFFQPFFNFKAPGGRNVLQIDSAEGTGQQGDGVYKLVHILGADAQGNGIDTAEGFEQDAFALHHRHTGFGADVTKTKDGGAVGDDGNGVTPSGKGIAEIGILLNLDAGLSHAGGIGKGEIVLGLHLHFGYCVQLAAPLIMELQGFFRVIHGSFPPMEYILTSLYNNAPFGARKNRLKSEDRDGLLRLIRGC